MRNLPQAGQPAARFLELKSQRELHLPWCALNRGELTEARRRRSTQIRILRQSETRDGREVLGIGDIEGLPAELQMHALGNLETLIEPEIDSEESGEAK